MDAWKVSEAKARFSELLGRVGKAPQLIYRRNRPIAAVVRIEDLESIRAYHEEKERPSLEELVKAVREIREEDEIEIPPRRNRSAGEWD